VVDSRDTIPRRAAENIGHLAMVRRRHEALAIRADHGLRLGVVASLEAIALAGSGSGEQDVRLLAAAGAAREEMGLPARAASLPDHLRGEAFDEAWRAGEALSLDEAAAYARRARGSRRRPESGWESLTTAEREVVQLAVEGLTNPEIGARLFMSRSTVKTHLSHVYGKLGVANRTELAALAGAEQGS
jgi:DNA-binding CsgD family transcriptional regulator